MINKLISSRYCRTKATEKPIGVFVLNGNLCIWMTEKRHFDCDFSCSNTMAYWSTTTLQYHIGVIFVVSQIGRGISIKAGQKRWHGGKLCSNLTYGIQIIYPILNSLTGLGVKWFQFRMHCDS